MHSVCRILLEKLLNTWQGTPDRTTRVTLPLNKNRASDYCKVVFPDDRKALHAGLEEAAARGTISLEWGKGYEAHILKRLILVDGKELADYLGIPLAARQAREAEVSLESAVTGDYPWIGEWVKELLYRWSRNKPMNGLTPGDSQTARLLILALEAVAAGRQRNLDLRTFSTRELGNSKAMETLLAKFAAIWKKYHPEDSGLDTDELAQTLGLVKFPLPLLLRGPVILHLEQRAIDCGDIEPYIGLPPQSIQGIGTGSLPDYVLTIENLASFNRYAAEVPDNGLIVYTAGFPAPGIGDFLRKLDTSLPANIPFYHWGDIDEGALKIFAYVQTFLGRTLQPHLMTPDLLMRLGAEKKELRAAEVRKIADLHPVTKPLADAILASDPPMVLEQEHVNPEHPEFSDPNNV